MYVILHGKLTRITMTHLKKTILFGFLLFSTSVFASVVPDFATNTYNNHNLSRSEKKCIDEGYKITYANCNNQTAPADRCPYHDAYYRSCSQEQWCRNNNFNYLAQDCKLPTYPVKICDNKYPMYRACQENIEKACVDAGYTSQTKCQLTNVRCPYNDDFGKCCDDCPSFSHTLAEIPAGYVADGPTCTTCDGIVKTNVIEAPCEDFQDCIYGPLSQQTPSCLKGSKNLYSACKTSEMHCKEKGYLYSTCSSSEDPEICPEHNELKKCHTNCFKLATEMFPEADIFHSDETDPAIDLSKTNMRSLYGKLSNACTSNVRPEITLNINSNNLSVYADIFNRNISNVNFILNFETPAVLPANGTFENVRIKITGDAPDCPLKGTSINVSGVLSVIGASNICTDINVADSSKFITTGNVTGNVTLGKDASLGIKGNLIGFLKTKSYAEILIKGIIKYKDTANNSPDNESIVFGCNSRAKISGGIIAETANVVIKQRGILDTPYIKLISTSNNPDLHNTLSSIHLQKYTKLLTTYDDAEYPLADNNDINCDDKYFTHLGSAVETENQETSLEPANQLIDKWQCRPLQRQQTECD